MIYGVDLSFANGTPNWQLAQTDDRVKFVWSRACYGAISADDDGGIYVNNHDQCKRYGLPFGGYIFWLMGQDGELQGEHFLQQTDGRYGGNAPVVDVEEGSGAVFGWGDSVQERIDCLGKTLTTIQATLGQPIIYTNPDTWHTYFGDTDAFSGHRLWLAAYDADPGGTDSIPGFEKVVAHQYTDGVVGSPSPIPGLSTPGNNVDRDVCWDLNDLARYD